MSHTDQPGVAAMLLHRQSLRHQRGKATADLLVFPTLLTLRGAFVTNEKLEKIAIKSAGISKTQPWCSCSPVTEKTLFLIGQSYFQQ